jgi:hypothetical protein
MGGLSFPGFGVWDSPWVFSLWCYCARWAREEEELNVTTLSAKADSFSDQSRVALEIRWPRPGQESACEDILRGVLVSVQGQPAVRNQEEERTRFLCRLKATVPAR